MDLLNSKYHLNYKKYDFDKEMRHENLQQIRFLKDDQNHIREKLNEMKILHWK